MIRRQARERREYLYRKELELREASLSEKRQQLKAALASGKPLPKDIAEDKELQKNFIYDESEQVEVDDEYSALSGITEPKVIVTTSRDPSVKLLQFSKEMKLFFPNSMKLNRGNYIISDIVASCLRSQVTDLVVLHEHRGTPTSLSISHFPHGPSAMFTLHNVKLRHDLPNIGNASEVYPHLIFENFTTDLGKRVVKILKHLFPPGAKKDSSRVITFVNNEDFISVRHHVYVKVKDNVELSEVGPRFEMRLYEIKLGLMDNQDCDTEWQLRRFTRTANRKNYLSK
ncbi:Piso0_001380 [Millerozyma farinosa CBS 7064]|uniref:U3 small nucleolar ribonucleoprotein protein IMP4 n=1 Tax=Pichia sorbitophila (strain ATCC MYA-4447 / BCRC 22081 / CBS 7064 / NBRC 10061 / NRRL Y-12695) TaxID=559304 RepID=G8YKM4_PICSO|nr:Piso0_001380 [Millerozyma farinosa CBS 7064]